MRNGIIWRFNLAKAPWWDVLFERLIRPTKQCLRKCVRNCTVTYEEFCTVLLEIKGVFNSQPLTCFGKDNIEESLTPIHLYCGHRVLNPIDGEEYESDYDFNNNREEALLRKHQLEQVLQSFWKCWRKDYLLELKSTQVGNKTQESNIKLNNIRQGKYNKKSRGKGCRAQWETYSYNETSPEAFSSRNEWEWYKAFP